jgi:hypothetical protein
MVENEAKFLSLETNATTESARGRVRQTLSRHTHPYVCGPLGRCKRSYYSSPYEILPYLSNQALHATVDRRLEP